ncbi:MAG: ABC transporter ATP-binding protein [Clostridiales bacterium]|nr:ABC transporter ATP-binding protein [Clostridiales bacterium]
MENVITAKNADETLLRVKDLRVYFRIKNNVIVKAVDGVNFELKKGKTLGIIGESGSGKSVTSRAIMRILESNGFIESGEIVFKGKNLLDLQEQTMHKIRGKEISLIFQDPTTSFNPYMTLGNQMAEAFLVHHKGAGKADAVEAAKQALLLVGINDISEIMKRYPFEFSAGFRQRVFIAMSMINQPDILIADEPTTSLGITIQAEVMQSLGRVQEKTGISIILITHDFGVISQFSDDIFVMYAGKCVEFAEKKKLITSPKHPYTVGLIQSVPILEERKTKQLKSIPGFPPDMTKEIVGCAFAPRCKNATEQCSVEVPELKLVSDGQYCACHNPMDYNIKDDTVL